MLEAAMRWVKFEISDGVNLGVVLFADEEKVRPFIEMTQINDQSREMIIGEIEKLLTLSEFKGQTCIGCALLMASEYSGLLNKKNGGNVLLITDGKQECMSNDPELCISLTDATDVYVDRNIRAVTIALGDEADPEIEDLAQRTGGKSFYVEVKYHSGKQFNSIGYFQG